MNILFRHFAHNLINNHVSFNFLFLPASIFAQFKISQCITDYHFFFINFVFAPQIKKKRKLN